MIDTRTKIVSLDEARRRAAEARREGRRLRVVTGYFDPLLPVQVARLKQLAAEGPMIAAVETPADVYLEAGARAELAASLDFIDCVILGGEAAAARVGAEEVLLEHEAEGECREAFIRYVRERAGS